VKYMGSKRTMLQNGLGDLLTDRGSKAGRFVDLFCGSGSVSWFAAEALQLPVLAVDIQEYAVVLAAAVAERTTTVDASRQTIEWIEPARHTAELSIKPLAANLSKADVTRSRSLCAQEAGGPIWAAYGGHYFSPHQARVFDELLGSLPPHRPHRTVCRAALIIAASRCAAAPGHTAQPFSPTKTALPHIEASWRRDPAGEVEAALKMLSRRHATFKGESVRSEAAAIVPRLCERDLVFVDPPYSAVHYSRFYHVLETIALGSCGPVSGVGRYPPIDERPRSRYSIKSEAATAMTELLEGLAKKGPEVILTFPAAGASNGIDGADLVDGAREHFHVAVRSIPARLSTLGGNGNARSARRKTDEMLLRLTPK
jgi:adenine-specific DNA-methyltransferase